MRCITIARALLESGHDVTFFVADDESEKLLADILADKRVSVAILGTDYSDMEAELPILRKELRDRGIGVLLVDSYKVTYNYFKALSENCTLAYMDDLLERAYPVDLVINYSGYSAKMGYEEAYGQQNTKLLLGLRYAPLREQFYNEDNKSKDVNRAETNIMIATGGADTCDMLMPLADEISTVFANKNIRYHVIIGDYVKDSDIIEETINSRKGMVVHRSVKNIAELMRSCDLAVVAAGTMLTECAAVGLPAIFYQVADNQKFNVDFFGNTYGFLFAGDVSSGDMEDKHTVIKSICYEMESLLEDSTRLSDMSDSLRQITDGRGALRIAEALVAEE